MNLLFILLGGGLGYAIFRPQKKDVVVVTDDEGVAGGLAGVTSIDIDSGDGGDVEGSTDKIFGGTDEVFGGGDVQTGTSTTIKDGGNPNRTTDVTGSPVSTSGGGYSATDRPIGVKTPTRTAITSLQKTQSRGRTFPTKTNPKPSPYGTITRTRPAPPKKKGFDGYYTDFDGVEDKNYGSRSEFDGVE